MDQRLEILRKEMEALAARVDRLEQQLVPPRLRGQFTVAPIAPVETRLGNTSEPPSKETG